MSRRAWVLFASVSLIWGVPYLFIKVAVDGGISPFFLAWMRVALAAAILCAVAPRQTRELLLRGPRRWIAGLLLILAGSWLATDDRLPPDPTAIVTRLRGRRGGREAEATTPLRAAP